MVGVCSADRSRWPRPTGGAHPSSAAGDQPAPCFSSRLLMSAAATNAGTDSGSPFRARSRHRWAAWNQSPASCMRSAGASSMLPASLELALPLEWPAWPMSGPRPIVSRSTGRPSLGCFRRRRSSRCGASRGKVSKAVERAGTPQPLSRLGTHPSARLSSKADCSRWTEN